MTFFSPKGKKKGKSSSPSPVPPPEPLSEESAGPPLPQPGEPDWTFVDEPIADELVQALVPYWENTEKSYKNNMMSTFRQIRAERESIMRWSVTTYIHTYMHARAYTHTRTHVRTRAQAVSQPCLQYANASEHKHSADTRRHTQTFADTHTNTQSLPHTISSKPSWLGIL